MLYITSGFWPRVRALALRAPPPAYCSFAAFPEGPNSAARGVISFHWAKLHLTLHHTELRCTLLSSASPNELHCTLLRGAVPLRYAAPYLSVAAPYLIYAAPSGILWAMLHPLSYAAPFWATLHPTCPTYPLTYPTVLIFMEVPMKHLWIVLSLSKKRQ
jgi:hypothetical protein